MTQTALIQAAKAAAAKVQEAGRVGGWPCDGPGGYTCTWQLEGGAVRLVDGNRCKSGWAVTPELIEAMATDWVRCSNLLWALQPATR